MIRIPSHTSTAKTVALVALCTSIATLIAVVFIDTDKYLRLPYRLRFNPAPVPIITNESFIATTLKVGNGDYVQRHDTIVTSLTLPEISFLSHQSDMASYMIVSIDGVLKNLKSDTTDSPHLRLNEIAFAKPNLEFFQTNPEITNLIHEIQVLSNDYAELQYKVSTYMALNQTIGLPTAAYLNELEDTLLSTQYETLTELNKLRIIDYEREMLLMTNGISSQRDAELRRIAKLQDSIAKTEARYRLVRLRKDYLFFKRTNYVDRVKRKDNLFSELIQLKTALKTAVNSLALEISNQVLLSPVEGIVMISDISRSGNNITAGTFGYVMPNLSNHHITCEATLPISHRPLLEKGNRLRLTLDAYNDIRPNYIESSIVKISDPFLTNDSTSEFTISFKLPIDTLVEDRKLKYYPGLPGQVHIYTTTTSILDYLTASYE